MIAWAPHTQRKLETIQCCQAARFVMADFSTYSSVPLYVIQPKMGNITSQKKEHIDIGKFKILRNLDAITLLTIPALPEVMSINCPSLFQELILTNIAFFQPPSLHGTNFQLYSCNSRDN